MYAVTASPCPRIAFRFLLVGIFLFVFQPSHAQRKPKQVDRPHEKGVLLNGRKTGVWEYYDRVGNLDIRMDYSTGKLLYVKPDTSMYVVLRDSTWIESKLDVPPRYLGSNTELFKILQQNLRYPADAFAQGRQGQVLVVFEVSEAGAVENLTVLEQAKNSFGDAAIKMMSKIPNLWLQAMAGGQQYRSRFILPVTFAIIGLEKEQQKINYRAAPLAKWLPEITVTASSRMGMR